MISSYSPYSWAKFFCSPDLQTRPAGGCKKAPVRRRGIRPGQKTSNIFIIAIQLLRSARGLIFGWLREAAWLLEITLLGGLHCPGRSWQVGLDTRIGSVLPWDRRHCRGSVGAAETMSAPPWRLSAPPGSAWHRRALVGAPGRSAAPHHLSSVPSATWRCRRKPAGSPVL